MRKGEGMNTFIFGIIEYLRSVCGDHGFVKIQTGDSVIWDTITVKFGNDIYAVHIERRPRKEDEK